MSGYRAPGEATAEFERALERLTAEPFVLRPHIAGASHRSVTTVENARRICDEYLHGRYALEVIDIYQNPTAAPEELVVAAPILIRRLPLPLRRVIGDLSEEEKALVGLELIPGTREGYRRSVRFHPALRGNISKHL